ETFRKNHLHYSFVQENQSFSKKGVVRGLHFQQPPYAQAKLVTALTGKVLDVVVDLRPTSETFKQTYYCLLESSKRNMLLIPEGFAHGFAALEDSIFFYKCSSPYNKRSESGIRWNDPELKIDWKIENPIISAKDSELPPLAVVLENSLIS
ncbi:MAG TPA: dTDP-4-dehydrorhamnose 3,5-epimerase, partial [Chryseolinea sp.]|nr:dTDP-4-dehydrorhamnose 3,5-epimerase [Chryseolinea sp.]